MLIDTISNLALEHESYRPSKSGIKGEYYIVKSKDSGGNIIQVLSAVLARVLASPIQ